MRFSTEDEIYSPELLDIATERVANPALNTSEDLGATVGIALAYLVVIYTVVGIAAKLLGWWGISWLLVLLPILAPLTIWFSILITFALSAIFNKDLK